MKDSADGFTLVEILIVIAIVAVLALVVFVSLNPLARFADARNSNREQNVIEIEKAILEYSTDNSGSWPSGIPSLLNSNPGDNSSGYNSSGNPDCTYSNVTSGNLTNPANAAAGCMWADDPSLSNLIKAYLSSVPTDQIIGGKGYLHYFVALSDDNPPHLVVISASMETNGISSVIVKNGIPQTLFWAST